MPLLSAGAVKLESLPGVVSHGLALRTPIERPPLWTCTAASPATSDLPIAPLSPLVMLTSRRARDRTCCLASSAASTTALNEMLLLCVTLAEALIAI